jgi:hypothetical protein
MYIKNIDSIPEKHKYKCNEKIAKYLMNEKGFPLLSLDKKGNFYFASTDELYMTLERLPFWLRIYK